MGGLPIQLKQDARNQDRCNGCRFLHLSTLNDVSQVDTFTARCLKFQAQIRQWTENDANPTLFPLGIDCKEIPDKGA